MEDWEKLAERWGIFASFVDAQGQPRAATPEAIRRIADALQTAGDPIAASASEPQVVSAYQGDGRRGWLLAVQLYAVRSKRNWGHGDFTDLAMLVRLAADVGAAGVGLNPLHALIWDRPGHASPYSPNSRLFLNPLYIDLEAIPEWMPELSLVDEIARLRETELVDYEGVARIKTAALRHAYRNFRESAQDERRRDLDAFRRERGETLERFAAFEVLRRKFHGAWWEWPREWRRPSDDAIAELRKSDADEFGLHEFLQWVADRQLAACAEIARQRGLPVGLYIDVAVGVDGAGADAWIEQGAFLNGLSIGAPPDLYNPDGQDWGLTSHSPNGLVARHYAPLRSLLQSAMRHAGAIRIDHALGLTRLYVMSRGLDAKNGAYIRFPLERMLSVIAEESRKEQCIVIGEALGTVPEGFIDKLSAWGIWAYLVMMFEREWNGAYRAPDRYPEKALATFNTHDLPSFSGWMSGYDLTLKRSIGVDPGESDGDREKSRHELRVALSSDGSSFIPVVEYLARTPSRMLSIGIEDVLGMRDQANIPGTVTQHPNWRRRLPVDVEDLPGDQRLAAVASALARAGRGSG
jgi:4-alpha-glucanotransferase